MAAKPGRARNSRRSLRDERRRAKFRERYLATGNAYQSARDAGYAESTARTKSWELARSIRIEIGDALRARGLDEVSQARKLEKLQNAKCVKWNANAEDWDTFEDGDIQMRATQEINRLLDAYPAPKESDQRSPVQIIFPASFGAIAVQAAADIGSRAESATAEAKANG